MRSENYCSGRVDYSHKGVDLTNKIIGYCNNNQLVDNAGILLKDIFLGDISKMTMEVDGKGYYKLIGSINKSLHSESIKSQEFCNSIRRIIIEQVRTLRPCDNKDYSDLIKKSNPINTKNHSLCEAISLKVKNKSIDEKSIKKIDDIVENARKTMPTEEFKSTLLEAQVLVLSCRNKTVYEKINKVLAPYIEAEAQYQHSVDSSPQLVQQNAEVYRLDKENLREGKESTPVIPEEITSAISEEKTIQYEVSGETEREGTLEQSFGPNVHSDGLSNQSLKKTVSTESNSINDEFIESRDHCNGEVAKPKNEVFSRKKIFLSIGYQ